MNSRKKLYYFLIFLIMGFLPFNSFAQTIGDPCDDPDLPPCPIDGGLSLLIAAGIGIGAKKAYDKKRKTVEL